MSKNTGIEDTKHGDDFKRDLPGCVSKTVCLSDDVAVDFGTTPGKAGEAEVIGIEVLSASENLSISKAVRSVRLEILGEPVKATLGEPPS